MRPKQDPPTDQEGNTARLCKLLDHDRGRSHQRRQCNPSESSFHRVVDVSSSPPQVRLFIDSAYKKTIALVEEKRELITAMAELLLSKEVSHQPLHVM